MNKIKAAIKEDEMPEDRYILEMIHTISPDWEVIILPGTKD